MMCPVGSKPCRADNHYQNHNRPRIVHISSIMYSPYYLSPLSDKGQIQPLGNSSRGCQYRQYLQRYIQERCRTMLIVESISSQQCSHYQNRSRPRSVHISSTMYSPCHLSPLSDWGQSNNSRGCLYRHYLQRHIQEQVEKTNLFESMSSLAGNHCQNRSRLDIVHTSLKMCSLYHRDPLIDLSGCNNNHECQHRHILQQYIQARDAKTNPFGSNACRPGNRCRSRNLPRTVHMSLRMCSHYRRDLPSDQAKSNNNRECLCLRCLQQDIQER
jgi:hypothetical protein